MPLPWVIRRGRPGLASVFGALELRILEALWRRAEAASVRDLQTDFPSAAYTTLMTTLDRLHRKGVLDRLKEGRAFLYRPRYSRGELESGAAAHALGTLLGGEPQPILSFFVDEVSRHDERLLDELARLIDEKRRQHDPDRS